jgi:hypothetical protein
MEDMMVTTFSVNCAIMSPREFRHAPVMARVMLGCESNECWYTRAIDRAAIVVKEEDIYIRRVRSHGEMTLGGVAQNLNYRQLKFSRWRTSFKARD